MTDTICSQNIDLSSWITLYKTCNVVWVTCRNVWHSKHNWPVMRQPRYGNSFTDPVLLHTAPLFSFR